ncbi:MAG TPA: alpha/beta hydrolase [Hyphomicrobium sp.]|nr:alpha/beta hydrolase [Hyphomicrobium sp.]
MAEQVARARPEYFGAPGHQLFAMLHTPAATALARPAVVLCPPFGQEAIRAHRTFKVLAERLARAGHTVLRLDYFGTGDSDGDDSSLTMSSMAADIGTADAQIRQVSGASNTVWIGLGLGATAALQASATNAAKPALIMLWDPILDGADYLERLGSIHKIALQESLSLKPRKIPVATDVVEALGFAIAPALQNELRALSAATLAMPSPSVRVTLCASQEAKGIASFAQRCIAEGNRHVDLRHDIEWLVESIDNGALVPAKAVQVLVGIAGETA